MPDFSLKELVSSELLDRMRRLFKAITGVPMVVTDDQGVPLIPLEEPLKFCGSLVDGSQGTLCLRRQKWDVPEPELEAQLREVHAEGELISHKCRGGFKDAAVPIRVKEQVVGYVVFARSLPEPPDIEHFRQIALEGGMDAEVGEAVANAALVMPEERIAATAEFLQVVSSLIASAAYDKLKAKQILELEELRDSLVHMIVHDLRTPLTSIMGALMTIVNTGYEPELTHEFVPMALSSSQTLLEMINTLLDVNKLESGQMQLELAEVDFNAIAELALSQVKALAKERSQSLTLALVEECPRPLVADAEKLRRVLINLLGNAMKFTQVGGSIRITSRCEDDGFVFSVVDNGPGIPEQDRERIFEKFGQASVRSEGHKYSTGLGLTFCKLVAEAHGGRIWVDSTVGKGSAFSVWLPWEPAQAKGE